jgi:hypothetical protein
MLICNVKLDSCAEMRLMGSRQSFVPLQAVFEQRERTCQLTRWHSCNRCCRDIRKLTCLYRLTTKRRFSLIDGNGFIRLGRRVIDFRFRYRSGNHSSSSQLFETAFNTQQSFLNKGNLAFVLTCHHNARSMLCGSSGSCLTGDTQSLTTGTRSLLVTFDLSETAVFTLQAPSVINSPLSRLLHWTDGFLQERTRSFGARHQERFDVYDFFPPSKDLMIR